MMSIVKFLLLSLVSVPCAELLPRFTATPLDPFYVLEGNNATFVWQYNLSGTFDRVVFQFSSSTPSRAIVIKPALNTEARVSNTFYQGRIQENINATRAEITIFALQRSESGQYEIQVTDSTFNPANDKMTVQVQYPPEFNSVSSDVIAVEGDPNITLKCITDGEPTPNITWTKVYAHGSESGVLGTGNQFILENDRNSNGKYRCTAYNGIGTPSNRTVEVEVHYKPENVTLAVNDSFVCKGDVISITCSADGKPAAHTYQLFENEIPVNDGNSSAGLWIRKDLKGGYLSYRCVANNTVGTTEKTVNVTEKASSSIQAIQGQNIPEGHNLTLICNVSGMPPPLVSWIKPNGQSFAGKVLELVNINRIEAGEYTCEASNECGNATEMASIDVQFKPENVELAISAVNNKACKGDVVNFTCSADANPAVSSYQLFENDTAILDTNAVRMWNKTLTSGGVYFYKCVAKNTLGSTYSTNVMLTVNVHSSIQAVDNQKVIEDDNVTLMCNVMGMPPPMVSWMTPDSQRVSGFKLEIANINRSQAGEYTCEASNECGNATETATIHLQYKPENIHLISSAVDSKVCTGEVISFNCSANANPGVTSYQLFENETAILNTSAAGMWSKSLENEGFFVYKCVANNSLGSEYSLSVTVTVNVPSEIEAMQDQNVTEDDNLTLTCTASGIPQPKVSWIKPNGQSVAGHVLQFVNINRSEDGEYKCEANNECGNATEMATIDVQYKPENVQFITSVIDDKACQGNTITFNCSADAKPAVKSYQLFKNDTAMDVSLSGIWSETLTRGGVFVYKCVANNTLGTASSTNVTVIVNVPSSIQAIDDKMVTEGDNLTLMCNVSGMPPSMVSWMTPNVQRHSGYMLNVVNINRSQAGEYKCEASNECDNATETVTIDVQYASRITKISGEQVVNKGDEVSLICLAEGNPAPRITWTKVADTSQVNFPLTIRGSQDEGLYRCTAENGVGSLVTKDVNMTVNFPAAIVAMGNHTAVRGGTIVLYCNASGTPPSTVLWMHVKSGETWNQKKWTIEGIQVGKLGEYKCDASNKYGRDIKSTFILYEGGFCEETCSAGKLCRKFGDTYFCVCPPGKTGANCQETEEPQKNFFVGLKLKGEFKQVYEDLENPETKTLVQNIEKNMMEEFKGTGLLSVKVLKLRQGSIIADLELTFNNSVGKSNVNALLTQAATKGKIGDLEVEDFSVGKTFPELSRDCGTFFEGEDCKKAKPGLIVLCVIGGVVVVAIIVAMIAYGLHKRKKKSRVGSLSNANKKDEASSDLAD